MNKNIAETPGDLARRKQRQAADPAQSVWVSASAGTGKTRVLIDRVLRLLLPGFNGKPGTRPDRILCLTYTRAAALEMTERLLARVADWVSKSEEKLAEDLLDLLGEPATPDQIKAARRLFAQLADGPERVRIMTIHAFCQSILARFPLEAGLPPRFELISGIAQENLLHEARSDVLRRSRRDNELGQSLQTVLSEIDEETFMKILAEMFGLYKRELTYALARYPHETRESVFCVQLGLPGGYSKDQWKTEADLFFDEAQADLKTLVSEMAGPEGGKRDADLALILSDWMALPAMDRAENLYDLSGFVYNSKGERRSEGKCEGIRRKKPFVNDLYVRLCDQIETLIRRRKAMDLVRSNMALFHVAEEIMKAFDSMKRARGFLDFDDVIRYTLRLLMSEDPGNAAAILSWVMYKLDGGIDHILVDEAQDTNAEQWSIIQALAASFFDDAGAGARTDRTLFVVGDQKQSIYSFQGADPESFEQSIAHIAGGAAHRTGRSLFNRIPLNTSFRSGKAVLDLVDRVFEDKDLCAHIRETTPITHVVHRRGQAGVAEIWPLEIAEEKEREDTEEWPIPVHIRHSRDEVRRLSLKIAQEVRRLCDSGERLESCDRPIEPGDILILVRKRAPFLAHLAAALRRAGVPVGGLDRLELTADLAVADVLAVARFSLLPEDDLNTACLLKSPLIGYNDDDLIRLAPGRTGSLWQALSASPPDQEVADYLRTVFEKERELRPYRFLSWALSAPCPADPEGSGLRALMGRLSENARETLDSLMDLVLQMDLEGQSLLHILHAIVSEKDEIKREGGGNRNVVRLMTVHGSKGLEAPIVILPDTILPSRAARTTGLFWPRHTGKELPIWSPRQKDRPEDLTAVLEEVRRAELAEYDRLLYVALTRAQERLIVAGTARREEGIHPESWYVKIEAGFDRLKDRPGFETMAQEEGERRYYRIAQTADPDRIQKQTASAVVKVEDLSFPNFLRVPLPPDPDSMRVLRSERASSKNDPVSPLAQIVDPHRFHRGLLTHKLLQILPDLPSDTWDRAAQTYLKNHRGGMNEDQIVQIWPEVRALLTHDKFSRIFGPGSRAEVPVTGFLPDRRLVAGQIDRLLITPDLILIVDYKTNRPPPATVAGVPDSYLQQMKTYAELLRTLYPDRAVQAGLIWTQGPRFMDLTSSL